MNPRVYVGTYRKYNEGSIFGKWLDLEDYSDLEEFYEACAELHSDEEDPEFMFQDHEDCCGLVSESSIDERIFELLDKDESDQDIICMYLDEIDDTEDFDRILEMYSGSADSEADFAQQQAEDLGDIPSDLPSWICIDWEASWNSGLRFDYNVVRKDGECHFFHND